MQKNSIEYYLALDYDIKVVAVIDDDEREYKAFSEDLGEYAIYGIGKTKVEAIENFEIMKKEMLEYYIENNIQIPEPVKRSEVFYSGKFVLRTTPFIHEKLVKLADSEDVSLNQFINNILNSYITTQNILSMARSQLQDLLGNCEKNISQIFSQRIWESSEMRYFDTEYTEAV